ncbi:MAG: DUF11 domain-containing protein [Acidobacteriota bacterium]
MCRGKFSNLLVSCAAGLLLLSLVWLAVVSAATAVGYLIVDRGGVSWATQGGSGAVLVGYGRIQPDAGSTTPAGLAIFGLRQNGILVTETGVPASALTLSGRIYAERSNSVNTGVAMANPNNQGALVNFFFTDINGNNFGAGSFTIPANGQRSAFLNEAPFIGGTIINGTFTYSSSVPISAVAIRGLNNERAEFLITTLPVVPLGAVVGETVLIPHFADGGGWTTQIILVNPTDESISGTIQFLGQGTATSSAQPVVVSIGGQTNSTFSYTIPSRSSRSLPTLGQDTTTRAGSVRITPLANQKTPAGLSVFSFRQAGIVVTEGGVPTLRPTTVFRMYAESAQVGAIQTGVAVANNAATPVAVNFELTTLAGGSTGLTGTETIGGNGQMAKFLNQIQGFGSLAPLFQGILRISTASGAGVAVVGLRGRTNERGDFLITTTSPADETAAASNAELDFPHFVDNGGYTTQFILFSSSASATAPLNGTLRFFGQNGQAADLNLGTPGADMSLTKSDSPDPAFVGADLTYTLAIRNNGPATATGVVVTDALPPGVSFVSATPVLPATCSFSGGTVTCSFGSVSNGDSKQVQIVVRPTAAGTLTNTATVTRNESDPVANNNSSTATTTVNADSANLSVNKTGPAFCQVAGTACADVTYTVTISNSGPQPATGVVLTDTLPVDPAGSGATIATLKSATPSQGTCGAVSGGVFTCTLGTIANGGSATVTVVVDIDATAVGRTATNNSSVAATSSDPDTSNNADPHTHSVFPEEIDSDVAVTMAGPNNVAFDTNAIYTATVTNNGPSTATAVTLNSGALPAGATLVSGSWSGGTCSVGGGALNCNLGTMVRTATRVVTIVLRYSTTGSKTFQVNVTRNENDPNAANNTASKVTTVP